MGSADIFHAPSDWLELQRRHIGDNNESSQNVGKYIKLHSVTLVGAHKNVISIKNSNKSARCRTTSMK
jgi:hypothetical protein